MQKLAVLGSLALLCAALGCAQKSLQPGVREISFPVSVLVSEKEASFKGAGDFELKGTFMYPKGDATKKIPMALLLPGSGPTDRDGNQGALRTDLLKQLAKELANHGIGSFRFDKRACPPYASKWPKDDAEMQEFFSWKVHVDDVRAAFATMLADGRAEKVKCIVVGHSEGGLLALASDVGPAALVLMGTPGRTFDKVVTEQIDAAMKRQGADESSANMIRQANARAIASIRSGQGIPADLPAGLKPLYNKSVGVYLRQLLDVDPLAAAKKATCPVIVLNGESDIQVDSEKDAKPLMAALESRTNGKQRLEILPLCSHNFKPVKAATDPGFEGEVVPDATEAIIEFLQETLALPPTDPGLDQDPGLR